MNFLREYWLRRKAKCIGGSNMSIEAPDGWFVPIKRMVVALARQKRCGYIGHDFMIDSMEDKFSVFRIWANQPLEPETSLWDAVVKCAQACEDICDSCGCHGASKIEVDGWIRTRCAAHVDEREAANARIRLSQYDIRKAERQMHQAPNEDLKMAIFCQRRSNAFYCDMAR